MAGNEGRRKEKEMKIKLARTYKGFGKGTPGWNGVINAEIAEGERKGERIAHVSYPNVDGYVATGEFRDLIWETDWVNKLEEVIFASSGGNHWSPRLEVEISEEAFNSFLEKARDWEK